MNTTELAHALAHRMHLGDDAVATDTAMGILHHLFAPDGIIAEELVSGRDVVIRGFGTFRRVKVGMKDVVPPKIGGVIVQPGMTVNEHYRAAWRAGATLAARVWPDKPPASVDDWGDEAQ